jgi:uncharacterized membrane protein YGL010W
MRSHYPDNRHTVGKTNAQIPSAIQTNTFVSQSTNSPTLISLPDFLQIKNLPPNLGTIVSFVYAFGYLLLEPVAGAMLAPLLIGGTAYMNHLTSTYGATATYWAAGLHVVSWLAQFLGHGKFEGRAPALLDNLVQALFLAPLFVWMEFLFFLGYRPELKARMNQGVEKEIAKFKKGKR